MKRKGTFDAWCPACKYFGVDCNPDLEDYGNPCSAFELDEGVKELAQDYISRVEAREEERRVVNEVSESVL